MNWMIFYWTNVFINQTLSSPFSYKWCARISSSFSVEKGTKKGEETSEKHTQSIAASYRWNNKNCFAATLPGAIVLKLQRSFPCSHFDLPTGFPGERSRPTMGETETSISFRSSNSLFPRFSTRFSFHTLTLNFSVASMKSASPSPRSTVINQKGVALSFDHYLFMSIDFNSAFSYVKSILNLMREVGISNYILFTIIYIILFPSSYFKQNKNIAFPRTSCIIICNNKKNKSSR